MSAAFWFMITVIVTVSLSFVGLLVWLGERDKERRAAEVRFHNETARKIAESGEPAAALEYLRKTEKLRAVRTRNGIRLGGLITIASGAAVMIFLRETAPSQAVYLSGLIPIFVGIALFIFTELVARPKD